MHLSAELSALPAFAVDYSSFQLTTQNAVRFQLTFTIQFITYAFVFLLMTYPVLEIVDELRQKLSGQHTIILQAPPGSGKYTVLPLEMLGESWLEKTKIVMLEPRRLAARSVAMRMASSLQQEVGKTIGYRVRFDTRVSPETKIEVVTEGILTRIMQQDTALTEFGLVIFDEFHERSLHADLALALCLQVQQVLRPDLRILIMSATLDAEKLSSVLNNAPVITSHGKQFSVTIHYFAPVQNIPSFQHTVRAIKKACHENKGDILVFLPGAGEIKKIATMLEGEPFEARVFPLYGDLPYKKQQEAILPDPGGIRKIILTTSIAETSLTIEGIGIVIDHGYSRIPRFNPRSGFTRLETVRVTKDSAEQRTGRAGRLGPGICYRLWSESIQANLLPQRIPEILEADLTPLMLELSAWGITNVNEVTWVTPPPPGSVSQAIGLLTSLGAIENGKITVSGKAILRLPTHPRIAHMLVNASFSDSGNLSGVATDLAALLEERDPLPKGTGADLSLRIDALRRWRKGERVNAEVQILERTEKLAGSWRKLMKVQEDNETVDDSQIGKLLIAAYPERIARLMDKESGRYKLANGRAAKLPENDPLVREPWLVIADLDAGMGDGKIFLAAPVHQEDLLEISEDHDVVRWDEDRSQIVANVEKRIGSLTLISKPLASIPDALRTSLLCKILKENGLQMLGWDESHAAWQSRIVSLSAWRPGEGWPDVTDTHLLETAEDWLTPFLVGVTKSSDFKRLDLPSILNSILPWELKQRLDKLAPSKIQVPSGSMIQVNYFNDGRSPVMEVRLQEVFGLTETPSVNEGRIKIIMHLLSPGYKPVQVTQDLKSFWTNTYPEVRKELRVRYQKHSWPEDPWTAEAVRGAKKRR